VFASAEEIAVAETPDTASKLGPALAQRIGKQRYRLWFEDKTKFRLDGHVLTVGVPNRFLQEWLQKTFAAALAETARATLGAAEIKFVIDPNLFPASIQQAPMPTISSEEETQLSPGGASAEVPKEATTIESAPASEALTQQPEPAAPSAGGRARAARRWRSLQDFQVGACNRLAHAAMLNLLDTPDAVPNPATLYGPIGVGKTHLLEGVYTELRRKLGASVVFVTAEEFTNRFLSALHGKQMAGFRREFRNAAALFLDDFHFLANKGTTQEEFLYTFEALNRLGRPVVLTGTTHPKMIVDLLPELVDRLLGGGVWPLDPLDRETRGAVLRVKGAKLGVTLPEDAVQYLADYLHGNVRELEGALNSVRHFAQVHKLPLTLSVVREATGQLVQFALQVVQIKDVENAVCRVLHLQPKALRSTTREHAVSHARMVAMYLARHHTHASFTEIGRYFGRRNHTTAIAADKKVGKWKEEDATLVLGERRWRVRELLAAAERELLQ
jgi:chromosomal replication initiator protein